MTLYGYIPEHKKVDIVFLAANRPEFTAWSLEALARGTAWQMVRKLIIYTDGSPLRDGFIARPPIPYEVIEYNRDRLGGPVAIMNHYLANSPAPLWAKIDNDVVVPPGWLNTCATVMERCPQLDLLGIEPPLSRTKAPWAPRAEDKPPEHTEHLTFGGWPVLYENPTFARTPSIGGIGLFRTRAWQGRSAMRPFATYGGFTDWQIREGNTVGRVTKVQRTERGIYADIDVLKQMVIGWVVPPLKLFLLDRLPMEPFAGLSRQYIATRQQRPWTMYTEEVARELAGWWLEEKDLLPEDRCGLCSTAPCTCNEKGLR